MPKGWDVENKRDNIYKFNPTDIKIYPELNGRFDLPDITELKASILKNGQFTPVVVRSEGKTPVLVVGYSRLRAIIELNKEYPDNQIQISATYIDCNEQDAYALAYEENHRRNQTTELDDAHHFAQFVKWNWDKKAIAERFGVSVALVNNRLKLIVAEPEVQKALREKRIKPSAVIELTKLSAEKQRNVVRGDGKIGDKEIAVATNTVIKPNLRQVKEHIEMRMAQTHIDSVRVICADILDYMDGKASQAASQ